MISLIYRRKQIQRYLDVSIALSWDSMGFYHSAFLEQFCNN